MARLQTVPQSKVRGIMTSAKGIFAIGLEMDTTVQKNLIKDGMSQAVFEKELAEYTNRVGKELAEAAREKMYQWIRVGGAKNIGFTGQSAENLQVGSEGSGSTTTWYVFEGGSDTEGNTAIRMGVRAKPAASKKALGNSVKRYDAKGDAIREGRSVRHAAIYRSRNPYFAAIEDWAKKKGLKPQDPDAEADEDELIASGKELPSKRSRKDKRVMWRSMLWALWHTWKKKGQSVEYKRRWSKQYFDYGGEYVRSGSARYQATKRLQGRSSDSSTAIKRITAEFVMTSLYRRMGVTSKFGSKSLAVD